MIEQSPQLETVQPHEALKPKTISQIALSVTPNEFVVCLGETKIAWISDARGNAAPVVTNEFNSAISLSPFTAKMLFDGLQKALTAFEEAFGKIPVDPGAKLMTGDAPVTASKL